MTSITSTNDRFSERLSDELSAGWASCPRTENGLVRILSSRAYPRAVAPDRAVRLLAATCRATDHVFWSNDISLLEPGCVDASKLHGHRHVTDAYLLALAVHHGGRLVTNDRRIARVAVPGATDGHLTVVLRQEGAAGLQRVARWVRTGVSALALGS